MKHNATGIHRNTRGSSPAVQKDDELAFRYVGRTFRQGMAGWLLEKSVRSKCLLKMGGIM